MAVNILIATSEAVPFAKTGGLADVCGALPTELAKLGHQAAVIMPAFRQTQQSGQPIEETGIEFSIPIGSKIVDGRLLRSQLPESEAIVYLVQQDDYFDRAELYREKGEDYKDNCERFVFFCRAVMESIRLLETPVDILHCNDWQTGLIPAYLRIEYEDIPGYEQIVSLLTIHNMAYQGHFWHWDMLLTGLDWKYFNWRQMEFYEHLNLLKTGITFSDAINTVSPRYAQEIQSQPLGCGLEGSLQQRADNLFGIINGVDYRLWSPATDKFLSANYDSSNWQEGKAACKAALREEMGLPVRPQTPLVGLVGRLADQKGWNLVAAIMQQWAANDDVQWVILGTGEKEYHQLLSQLAQQHPEKVAAQLEFSNPLAHKIEAGSDIFLMPSLYEPCGLNQLYSLKYGAVPVVRATGGLADTITDTTSETIASGAANGFSFEAPDAVSLEATLRRACDVYRNHGEVWERIVETGMRQDWSWGNSARKYVELYEKMLAQKKQAALA